MRRPVMRLSSKTSMTQTRAEASMGGLKAEGSSGAIFTERANSGAATEVGVARREASETEAVRRGMSENEPAWSAAPGVRTACVGISGFGAACAAVGDGTA